MPIIINHGGSFGLPAALAATGGFVQGFQQKRADMRAAAMQEADFQKRMETIGQQIQLNKAKLAMMPMEQSAAQKQLLMQDAQLAQARANLQAMTRQVGASQAGADAIHRLAEDMFPEDQGFVDALSRSTDANISMGILNSAIKLRQQKMLMQTQVENNNIYGSLVKSKGFDPANEAQKKALQAAAGDPLKTNQVLKQIQADAAHNDGLEDARQIATKAMLGGIEGEANKPGWGMGTPGYAQRRAALSKLVGKAKHAASYDELYAITDEFTAMTDPAMAGSIEHGIALHNMERMQERAQAGQVQAFMAGAMATTAMGLRRKEPSGKAPAGKIPAQEFGKLPPIQQAEVIQGANMAVSAAGVDVKAQVKALKDYAAARGIKDVDAFLQAWMTYQPPRAPEQPLDPRYHNFEGVGR